MYIQKKTAGKRLKNSTDFTYALQEMKANKIMCGGVVIGQDGREKYYQNVRELEKVEPGETVTVVTGKGKTNLYALKFSNKYGAHSLQEFRAASKKAENFKRAYVAAYGPLVKRDGLRWSIGRIINLILSYYASANLEAAANRELRKLNKKVQGQLAEILAEMEGSGGNVTGISGQTNGERVASGRTVTNRAGRDSMARR